ncbi:CRISPR-associated endonuclease Cas2 [Tepidiforma thermophila]|uniref:CRISPR-associated endoribonuclease Cas2 n=1 Tax=Tepidiforma thermophila (strain KCTC 52669 / CGMCC 1.13589 / G233) TaxID=2761530 RepID=A0A2A9HEM9_TEPT2|nr:CRISPR-associated endonuclease Cas2 [Tepidiforma thermophila]PFG73560.1 CRISPR-associated Cas2 family protein [Tepidiforma thermophila]
MDERWYAIAYDIPDNRRREALATWLEGWGERVQRSVFEFQLRPSEFARMLAGIRARIDPAVDQVRVYHLGARGYRSIEVPAGPPARPRPRWFIV